MMGFGKDCIFGCDLVILLYDIGDEWGGDSDEIKWEIEKKDGKVN